MCSPSNASPMKTLRQGSVSLGSSFFTVRMWRTRRRPLRSRSRKVSENRSGPLLAETTVLPPGLMANPNGPGPVMYWMPVGKITRPPGRMLAAPGRRMAGRVPAGAAYSAALRLETARTKSAIITQSILA